MSTNTRLTRLTLRNFLSIGAVTQTLNLDEYGLTLVLGSNMDTKSETSRNGAGKTSLLQAISYALYGQPLTKIRSDNLVNNINGKGMFVTLEFVRNDVRYRVERGRKPNILRFFVNDHQEEEDIAQGENRHTQEEIDRAFGMSFLLFKYLVINNTSVDPFLRMKAADQREFMEELLGATHLSQRAEVLKKLVSASKEGMRIEEATIKATQEANNRIEAAIRKAINEAEEWDGEHSRRLHELSEEIESVSSIDFDKEIQVFDEIDQWNNLREHHLRSLEIGNKELSLLVREATNLADQLKQHKNKNPDDGSSRIKRLRMDINRCEIEADKRKKQSENYKAEAVKISEDLKNADGQICVCCGQSLTGTDHLKTVQSNLLTQINDLEEKSKNEEQIHLDLLRDIAITNDEINKVHLDALRASEEAKAKILEIEKKLETANDDVKLKKLALAPIENILKNLGPKPSTIFDSRDDVYRTRQMHDRLAAEMETEKTKTNPHIPHLESLRSTLQDIDYQRINDLSLLMKHQEFLLRLLTNKDSFIRKRIIDTNLAYLNTRLNHYLDKLELPHEVRFMSDLTVEIVLLGREFDFEQLSRGEMNRVTMATCWAFRDMWESMNTSINLIAVDELIDQGTDQQGAEAALTILKGMARDRGKNVMLISHRDDFISRVDDILLVSKTDGFTTFERSTH